MAASLSIMARRRRLSISMRNSTGRVAPLSKKLFCAVSTECISIITAFPFVGGIVNIIA